MRVTSSRMLGIGAALILATLTLAPARAVADEPSRLGQVGGRGSAVGSGAGEPAVELFESAGLAGDFRPVRLQGPAGAVIYEAEDPYAKDQRIKPLFLARQAGPLSRTPACGTDARRCETQTFADLVATRSLQMQAERSVRTALSQEEHVAQMPGVGRPGPLFDQVAAGEYRDLVIANLDYQRDHGIGVSGHGKVTVTPDPGGPASRFGPTFDHEGVRGQHGDEVHREGPRVLRGDDAGPPVRRGGWWPGQGGQRPRAPGAVLLRTRAHQRPPVDPLSLLP